MTTRTSPVRISPYTYAVSIEAVPWPPRMDSLTTFSSGKSISLPSDLMQVELLTIGIISQPGVMESLHCDTIAAAILSASSLRG